MSKKTACRCSRSVGTTCSCTGCGDCQHHAPTYRWIMYVTNPGGLGGALLRVTSFEAAKQELIEHGKSSGFYQDLTVYGTYGPTAALYPYTYDDWKTAKLYETIGNPFDYPSYLVESGPCGGVKVSRA